MAEKANLPVARYALHGAAAGPRGRFSRDKLQGQEQACARGRHRDHKGGAQMILFWFCLAVMCVVFTIGGIVSALVWFANTAEDECAKRRRQ